jgi:hypothetical protein
MLGGGGGGEWVLGKAGGGGEGIVNWSRTCKGTHALTNKTGHLMSPSLLKNERAS